jgi:hypothetical protein
MIISTKIIILINESHLTIFYCTFVRYSIEPKQYSIHQIRSSCYSPKFPRVLGSDDGETLLNCLDQFQDGSLLIAGYSSSEKMS